MGKDAPALRREPDPGARAGMGRQRADVAAGQNDAAFAELLQTDDRAQQCRLADAVAPDQGDGAARRYRHVDAREDAALAVGRRHLVEHQKRLAHRPALRPR
jgi:hypothetical protein